MGACPFPADGRIYAGRYPTVTRADGNDATTNEGSFRYEFTHMADGDTLMFAPELATETISLSGNISITATANTVTIIGNGLTIGCSSGYPGIYINATKARIENVRFTDLSEIITADSIRITNCVPRRTNT
jgi:hypothetical protein